MQLKALLEQKHVYQTTLDGESYVWRLLTFREMRRIEALRRQMLEMLFYESIFEICFLGNYSSLNENLPAGYTMSIGRCIYAMSGGSGAETLVDDIAIERSTYAATGLLQHMRRVIFTAWPQYTPEDIETWTYKDLIEKFNEGEHLLAFRLPEYESLDLRKIKFGGQAHTQKIDFEKEAAEQRAAMGNSPFESQAPVSRSELTRSAGARQRRRG